MVSQLLLYKYNKYYNGAGEMMILKIDLESEEALYVQPCNQIIMGIEEEFGIEIDNDAAETITTVGDAVEQIKKAIN